MTRIDAFTKIYFTPPATLRYHVFYDLGKGCTNLNELFFNILHFVHLPEPTSAVPSEWPDMAAFELRLNMETSRNIWVFPKIGFFPQNGWFIMENPIKMG